MCGAERRKGRKHFDFFSLSEHPSPHLWEATPRALVVNRKVAVLGQASLNPPCHYADHPARWPPFMPRFPGSHSGTSADAVDGSCSEASLCISPAPHVGKGGQDVFTESQPGSTREEEELFPLILPPPFGFLFWHCPRPKKRWEFGKVKVYHCISLTLHLISLLRKPGWTFFPPSLLNTQRLKIPFLLLM